MTAGYICRFSVAGDGGGKGTFQRPVPRPVAGFRIGTDGKDLVGRPVGTEDVLPDKGLQTGIGDRNHDHWKGIGRKMEKYGLARGHKVAQRVGRLFESDPIVAHAVQMDGAAVGALALHDRIEMTGQQGGQGMDGRGHVILHLCFIFYDSPF